MGTGRDSRVREKELYSPAVLSLSSSSCHQALLRLPDAAEAPHTAHHAPPAAGVHAGRAQAQALELLAEHQQADALPEIGAAPCLCLNPFWESTLSVSPGRWSPGSSDAVFTEDGTCAPAFPIYFAARLTRWLWGEAPAPPAGSGARSQPCTARQGKLQEHSRSPTGCSPRDLAWQLYLDSLLAAVPSAAGWQLSQGMAAHGPAGPVAAAVLRTTAQSPRWGGMNPSALPAPMPRISQSCDPPPRVQLTQQPLQALRQSTVSTALWPPPSLQSSTTGQQCPTLNCANLQHESSRRISLVGLSYIS